MHVSVYQESRRGGRRTNQDRIAYRHSPHALLALVADGMGGHLQGEVAAQLAVDTVAAAFTRTAQPRLPDAARFLREAIASAHGAILHYAAERKLAETPRTTCVACVVQDGIAHWAHAGDSRLYHIRDGVILAQTKDHSLVQQLVDSGRMRAEAVAVHPARNRVFSCLGSLRAPLVDYSPAVPLCSGDSLLLCSDGLWLPLTAKLIASTVHMGGILKAVPALLDDAQRRAGADCDNLSAIGLTWQGDSCASQVQA